VSALRKQLLKVVQHPLEVICGEGVVTQDHFGAQRGAFF